MPILRTPDFPEEREVSGTPYLWYTNLADAEVRALYKILLEARFLVRKAPFTGVRNDRAVFSIDLDSCEVQYKGESCTVIRQENVINCSCKPI